MRHYYNPITNRISSYIQTNMYTAVNKLLTKIQKKNPCPLIPLHTKDEDRRNLIKDGIFLHHLANSICGNTAEHLFKYIAKNIKMSIYRMVHKFSLFQRLLWLISFFMRYSRTKGISSWLHLYDICYLHKEINKIELHCILKAEEKINWLGQFCYKGHLFL